VASLADTYLDTAAASEEDRLWGDTISIRRGSQTTTGVTAQKWLGMRIINLDDGGYIQWTGCEWIITKAMYMIGGVAVRPKSGDRIIDSESVEWELSPIQELSEVLEQDGGLEWMLRSKRVVGS
jgi:hypothetical protein